MAAIDKELIQQKIHNIQNCLNSIKQYTNLDPSKLEDQMIQDAVIINLERAIQACIDMASHIVSRKALGVPSSMKENFTLLGKNRIIELNIANKLEKMVGFRNIVVHNYDVVELNILKEIVKSHLKDFEDYYSQVLESI